MFISRARAEVDICDTLYLQKDYTVELRRVYSFTNTKDRSVTICWEGLDALPSADCSVSMTNSDAVLLGRSPEHPGCILWQLVNKDIAPGESIEVAIQFGICNILRLQPLSFDIQYAARAICQYSFEVIPTVGEVFTSGSVQCDDLSPVKRKNVSTHVGQDGHLYLDAPVRVSGNTFGPFHVRVTKVGTNEIRITRLLQTYTNEAQKNPGLLAKYVFVVIPHLLRDSYSLFRAFVASGLDPHRTFIIGIPYSTKNAVVSALWEHGFGNVRNPARYPFSDEVDAALSDALTLCAKEKRRLIIVEDGGYAGPLLHTKYKAQLTTCAGIVEQTRNGIWRYTDAQITPAVPVLNVAECPLKIKKESPLIGEAIVGNVRALLGAFGYRIQRFRPLVVGYGSTGGEVAKELKKIVRDVAVFDQKKKRREAAAKKGFATDSSIDKLVRGRSLIISCTGSSNPPFKFLELATIENNAVFASGSSKRLEIDYSQLRALGSGTPPEHIPDVGTRYTLVTRNSFVLLTDGYPVNFMGESVPDEDISFIVALLYKCARHLAEQDGNLKPGILPVPQEIEDEVEARYNALMPRDGGGD